MTGWRSSEGSIVVRLTGSEAGVQQKGDSRRPVATNVGVVGGMS